MLRLLTAGESHGKALTGVIEGMVAGLRISEEEINSELNLRKKTWGRGSRSSFEEARIEILSGVIEGKTIGSPITLRLNNREQKFDHASIPRPGHADLAGSLKYGFENIHFVAERASARETAMRVAAGKIAKMFLSKFGVDFFSHTLVVGGIKAEVLLENFNSRTKKKRGESDLLCLDKKAASEMKEKIIQAKQKGDTLGGVSEILIKGLPPGIGSHVHYDRRLDFRLAGSLMSIPSVKAVEIGEGFKAPELPGSQFQDAFYGKQRIHRKTNNAGGIEGGISNGEVIILRLYVKPVPTLKAGLPSIDMKTGRPARAPHIRSDICVVPSVNIIGEAVAAWEIASCFLDKFGGDTLEEVRQSYNYFSRNLSSKPLFKRLTRK